MVNEKLSPDEREVLDRFERGELRPVADAERELEAARQAAANTLNKTQRVGAGHPVDKPPTDR